MPIASETELYAPVKSFLQQQGYEVKAEVHGCDIVAIRYGEEPVIVELKKTFNIPLLVQGIDRLRHSQLVYVAVEKNPNGRAPHNLAWSELQKLCRRLGLGLMTVRFYKTKKPAVEVLCDPTPYEPRKSAKRVAGLLTEFHERSGDYNVGGSTRRKLVTAYREKSIRCAAALHTFGPLSTRRLREVTGNAKVAMMLQDNYYHWFRRVSRGVYELTPAGAAAVDEYAHVLGGWQPALPAGKA